MIPQALNDTMGRDERALGILYSFVLKRDEIGQHISCKYCIRKDRENGASIWAAHYSKRLKENRRKIFFTMNYANEYVKNILFSLSCLLAFLYHVSEFLYLVCIFIEYRPQRTNRSCVYVQHEDEHKTIRSIIFIVILIITLTLHNLT